MSTNQQPPEFWINGPVKDLPALLQPAAHTLLQARREVNEMMHAFPDELLLQKVAGMASPGFHLQHMVGVLNRLFTYADSKPLNNAQLEYLANEGIIDSAVAAKALTSEFSNAVEIALTYLKNVDEKTLTDLRGVGRKQLSSTVIGLLFHAAEHVMRHTGQLLVTTAVLKDRL